MKFNGNTMAAVMAVEQEAMPIGGGFMEGTLGTKGIRLTEDVDYGKELPAAAPTGTLFFVEDGEADFVVEQGSDTDGWSWRKWNSGIAECWAIRESTINRKQTVNGFYFAHGRVTFPFAFIVAPVVTYSVQATSGYDFCGRASVYPKFFTWYSGSTSSMQEISSITIHTYAIGRWK